MVEAEYKHPNFTAEQASKEASIIDAANSTMRLEYPDGVIVVFALSPEGVTLQSNYGFKFDVDNNIIYPNLDDPNPDFQDIK